MSIRVGCRRAVSYWGDFPRLPLAVIIFRKNYKDAVEYLEEGVKEEVVNQRHSQNDERQKHQQKFIERAFDKADLTKAQAMEYEGYRTEYAHRAEKFYDDAMIHAAEYVVVYI